MKNKRLIIIFTLFLLIVVGGLVVFLTKEKSLLTVVERSGINEEPAVIEKQIESATDAPIKESETATSTKEKIIQPKIVGQTAAVNIPVEEKIKAVMIIEGDKYDIAIKPDSSAYEVMNLLKNENKINFSGKDYSSLGFFVEEINGIKNNPSGENWLYYVNGQPAQVGISNYIIKNGDTIEWKYEKKSF